MTAEEAIEKIRQFGLYHAEKDLPHSTFTVEAFEMAIEALEKQIPKKPIGQSVLYRCPACDAFVLKSIGVLPDYYCVRCGQKIDWSEEEK